MDIKKNHIVAFSLLIVMAIFSSCHKDHIPNNDPKLQLSFSNDTILFDTVFTSLGSTTHRLMIYNQHNDMLKISSIRLAGGNRSPFRLNFDGEAGTEFYDKKIPGNDSLFSFLRVTINPNDLNTPFLVEDSLEFITNGNRQMVRLVAYGQNANYIVADRKIGSFPKFKIVADSLETTVWTNERPYVIYGYALVNSYGTLHIEAGTHIYIHNKGGIWTWSDGQLIIDGTQENPVIIEGDRLEPYYKDQPGQWDRIWLMDGREGADNIVRHAIIRNGFIGIHTESFVHPTRSALRLENTIIENHSGFGIFSRLYAIKAKNLVVANCGNGGVSIHFGGDYRFIHTTIANNNWKYGNAAKRPEASVFLNNYAKDTSGYYDFPLRFELDNSIVYGNLDNEFSTDFHGSDTTYVFDHCLIKTRRYQDAPYGFNNCIFNRDPLFVDYNAFDYHIDGISSPAIGVGNPIFGMELPFDLDGVSRGGIPDLGAYQHR
ncbi:MAG: hypothetical protein ACTTKO_07680 [Candidatus Limimorpha sp.]